MYFSDTDLPTEKAKKRQTGVILDISVPNLGNNYLDSTKLQEQNGGVR
jgi:hypothetical protein